MKQDTRKKSGYILLLVTIMLSAIIAVVTYLVVRSSTYMPFMHTSINRQKAKTLALGGIQVVRAQLARPDDESPEEEKKQNGQAPVEAPKETQDKKPLTAEQKAKSLLTRLLPIINRWQTFDLREKTDGIDGRLTIYLACEQGKININALYDFKKKKFVGEGAVQGDVKKFLEGLFKNIQQLAGGSELLPAFEKFLKERKHKLIDVTELLTIKEFAPFKYHQFVGPVDSAKREKQDAKPPVYLTDIFTVHSNNAQMQPWLLSDSLVTMLGMKKIDAEAMKKEEAGGGTKELLKSFKRRVNWKQNWDTLLKPLYGKELHSLPKGIELVFDELFDPKIFSACVHATVGGVTQRLFVILERKESVQDGKTVYDVNIKKLYWL